MCYATNCDKENAEGKIYCEEHTRMIENGERFARKMPACHGLSDGPGVASSRELIFDRPNPKRDIPITLRKMEEAGQLKNPGTLAFAKMKMEKSKHMPDSKTDYQKGGHPLE